MYLPSALINFLSCTNNLYTAFTINLLRVWRVSIVLPLFVLFLKRFASIREYFRFAIVAYSF